MSSARKQVNIHEAKTHFSRLLERVAAGEEITIAKAGRPIARLVPIEPVVKDRTPGRYAGEGWIAEDFDAPLPEDLLRLFEGGSDE
jgi:prevent-host-death family protein